MKITGTAHNLLMALRHCRDHLDIKSPPHLIRYLKERVNLEFKFYHNLQLPHHSVSLPWTDEQAVLLRLIMEEFDLVD